MGTRQHPCNEGYETIEGHNIEADWEDNAACLKVEEDVFFVGARGFGPEDFRDYCSGCEVRQSCLMDALATKDSNTSGRRAGEMSTTLRAVLKKVTEVVTDTQTHTANKAYGGQTRAEFFGNDKRAPKLVSEYMKWHKYREENQKDIDKLRQHEPWPTAKAQKIISKHG